MSEEYHVEVTHFSPESMSMLFLWLQTFIILSSLISSPCICIVQNPSIPKRLHTTTSPDSHSWRKSQPEHPDYFIYQHFDNLVFHRKRKQLAFVYFLGQDTSTALTFLILIRCFQCAFTRPTHQRSEVKQSPEATE